MRRVFAFALLATAGCAGGQSVGDGMVSTPATPTTTRVLTDGGNISVRSNADVRVSRQWVRGPIARVQAELPGVYEALGLPMAAVTEGEVPRFQNPGLTVNRRIAGARVSEYLSCGTTPIGTSMADASTVQLQMHTELHGGAEGTELRTRLTGAAFARAGSSGSGTGAPCTSTGKLEQRIAQMVTERLGS